MLEIIQWILIIILLVRDIVGQISTQRVFNSIAEQVNGNISSINNILDILRIKLTNSTDINNKSSKNEENNN